MRRVRRPEEIPNRIRLVDFPTLSLSLSRPRFFFWRRDANANAHLSSTQLVASDAENNEAIRCNVKFFVTSAIHEIARRFDTELSYYWQL